MIVNGTGTAGGPIRMRMNVVYAHLKPDFVFSMRRGSVSLTYTSRPIADCDLYFYMDAFSYYGPMKGLNVLFLTEPTVVLPGQYDKDIWDRFDHVFTFYDHLVDNYGFSKCHIPRQGFHPWFGDSEDFIITDDLARRKVKYPHRERKPAICMINGNKHSSVPGELYSKRIEAALWFEMNSDIAFDVYGMVPYFLPNYRGQVENNKKLQTLSQYRYALCFENTADPVFARGYVDKILDALESRTVPVYLGCPNIEEYIPKECFIDFREFADYPALDDYLRHMSEKEYMKHIESIDTWVCNGGLRTYSWYPLYDSLVAYYARQKDIDPDSLFGEDPAWREMPRQEGLDLVQSPPLWTYQEHAAAPSPLMDWPGVTESATEGLDEKNVRLAIEHARKGNYREAARSMAWLRYYRSADLLCFYAQILHMLGRFEAEAVYLRLALQANPRHSPSLRQMETPCSSQEDFRESVLRFAAMIRNGRIEAPTVPGLTSIIIPALDLNDTLRKCLESIGESVSEPLEVVVSKNHATAAPSWLIEAASRNSRLRIVDTERTGYAALCNNAVLKTCGQYILLLDAGGTMLRETLSGMLECMKEHPEYGITVPMSNSSPGIQQIPRTEGLSLEDFHVFAGTFRQRNHNRRTTGFEIDHTCVLIKRSVFDVVGLFNEELETPYSIVNDLRLRALAAGQGTIIASDTCIYLSEGNPHGKDHEKLFNQLWDRFDPRSEVGSRLLPFVVTKNARDSYGKGLLDEAIHAVMEGIKYTPEEPELYYCLAEILMDAKLYGQAMEALQSLPDAEKGSARALEMLGYCQYHTGHAPEAGNCADQTLSLCFDSMRGLNLKGMLASELGDREKAEAFFRTAIDTDPGFADPYVNLGVMKWHAGQTGEALDLIEKGFILSPHTSDFSATYNSAVTALREFPRAETVLLEASRLFPTNKKLSFLYIGVLLQQEKYPEAMRETERSMITFGIDDGILTAALQIREKVGPEMLREDRRKGSLSACMIVKNEEEQIARCLASLKPVADEIIIADTGSTDRTRDICRAFGAQVYDFTWTNDFSEARNFSMSKARGQWVLIHDADEVISPRDYGKLRAILSQDHPKPVAYSLVTRNYSIDSVYEGWTANAGDYPGEEAGKGWFPSPKVRLLINDERFRFENPIHELLEPSLKRAGVGIKACDVVVHHYGQTDPERSQTKAEMYYAIGKKKLETDGETEAALRELAVQARAIGRYDESIELWRRYITINPGSYLPYFNMSGCYFEKEHFEEAFRHAKKAFELNRESKETVQCYAVTSLFRPDPGDSIRVLENLLQRIPPYPTGKMTLAAAFCVTGMRDKGMGYLKEIKDTGYDCSEALYNLSKKFLAAGKSASAIALLECMQESGHVHTDGARLLQESYDALAVGA